MMSATEIEKTKALNIRDVPADLKKQYKLWCVDNGISMREHIISLMGRTILRKGESKVDV